MKNHLVIILFVNIIYSLTGCVTVQTGLGSAVLSPEEIMAREGDYKSVISSIDRKLPKNISDRIVENYIHGLESGNSLYRIPSIKEKELSGESGLLFKVLPLNDLSWYNHYTKEYLMALIALGEFDKANLYAIQAISHAEKLDKILKERGYSASAKYNSLTLKTAYTAYGMSLHVLGIERDIVKNYILKDPVGFNRNFDLPRAIDEASFLSRVLGEHEEALEIYKGTIQALSEYSILSADQKIAYTMEAYQGMVWTLLKLGRLRESEKALIDYAEVANSLLYKTGRFLTAGIPGLRGYLSTLDATGGALYSLLQDEEKAKEYFSKARSTIENIPGDSNDVYDRLAQAKYEILYGAFYLGEKRQYREALKHVSRGISLFPRAFHEIMTDEINLQTAYIYSAELRYKIGDYENALVDIKSAFSLANKFNDSLIKSRAYTLRGEIKQIKNNLLDAKSDYENALKAGNYTKNTETWRIYYRLAQIYEKQANVTSALQYYKKAIGEVEKLWSGQLSGIEKQLSYVGNRLEVYGPAIRLLVEKGVISDAVELMDKSKARTLYQSGAFAEENNLSTFKPLAIDQIKDLIPDDMAVLIYHVGNNNVSAAFVDQKLIEAINLQVSPDDLAVMIDKQRCHITSRSPSVDIVSAKLYDALVKPLHDQINNVPRLLVIPHGVLHYLPFQALLSSSTDVTDTSRLEKCIADKTLGSLVRGALDIDAGNKSVERIYRKSYEKSQQSKYLAELHEIIYSPSISVIDAMLKQQKNSQPPQQRKLLAAGSPPLNKLKLSNGQLVHLPKLTYAEKEVKEVSNLFKNKEYYIGARATESVVKEKLPNTDVVLMSTHGLLDPENPTQSAIILSAGKGNDGRLTVGEIMQMRTKADMVVLSACQTGVVSSYTGGTTQSINTLPLGDDLVSLNRSFLTTGTKSILATLWFVDDASTEYFVKNYFENYQAGNDKTRSLQQVQNSLISSEQWSHPYYWAPFSMNGLW